MNDWRANPHRRYNPLTGEWVLVSPQRLQRPWQGAVAAAEMVKREAYDPNCYLCPGNARMTGERNPRYENTFVFDNDYAALRSDTPGETFADGLLQARAEAGIARVLCFSPRHDLDIAQMEPGQIAAVVDTWAKHYTELRDAAVRECRHDFRKPR